MARQLKDTDTENELIEAFQPCAEGLFEVQSTVSTSDLGPSQATASRRQRRKKVTAVAKPLMTTTEDEETLGVTTGTSIVACVGGTRPDNWWNPEPLHVTLQRLSTLNDLMNTLLDVKSMSEARRTVVDRLAMIAIKSRLQLAELKESLNMKYDVAEDVDLAFASAA